MITIDSNKCVGCKICTHVCPQNVIKLIDKKAIIAEYSNCMECGACKLNCEYNAIEVTKGTGCLVAIIKEDILKISSAGEGCGSTGDDEETGCC